MPHVIRTQQTPIALLPVRTTTPVRSLVDAEAVAVLHRAARVLLDDLAGLTDRLVATLRAQEPAYRVAIDADASEIWQEVHRSLRHNIGSLIRPREARDAARRTSWRIGATRAEQGVPLDAVLHAFRLGGAMVWQGLIDETARRHADDIRLLIHVAADVWNFVDEHCGLVADAYRQTERRMAWRRENRLRLMTAALLEGSARVSDLPDAAAMLDLPADGSYAVLAVAGLRVTPQGDAPPLPLPPGTRAVWHASADAHHAIVPLTGAETVASVLAGLAPPPGVRVGVSSAVTGIAAVGEARRLADIALRTCPRAGGVVLLDDHLPAALVASSPDLGAALAGRVLGPLDRLDPADRDLLVETLTAWLDSDGSARRAAARLYCHRNTVLNRLRRFEQLTGRSLARPTDAVEVSLALVAGRLHPRRPDERT
ncbi:PucR family transcriptional regulator [Streptomyces sp. AcH 505]|uniref:PucR family transcriptional regulator n=1 Tax=unclassified Streptomyces TaxID=2593676 RepID=UPI000591979F|nr:PucR family transcriptional regulator [Streptomyces sp. NBC_00370]KIF70334.1 PucR family transcriptional regulator [Streptomyces sp. AcH 505]